MKRTREEKAITLVALIITIVVLLILALVTINAVRGDGIIGKAQKAKEEYEKKADEENTTLEGYLAYLEENEPRNNNGETGNSVSTVTPISTEKNYTGCYADTNEDGKADGVIYIDLANTKSSSWVGVYKYTIKNVTEGLKDYYVSGSSDDGKDIITIVKGSEGIERFYVMALNDITAIIDNITYETFTWYRSGTTELDDETMTSQDVGKGITNTSYILNNVWGKTAENGVSYGTINDRDMWNFVAEGWFIPSIEEWYACCDQLGIYSTTYESKGFSSKYWSSCLSGSIKRNCAIGIGINGEYRFGDYTSGRKLR